MRKALLAMALLVGLVIAIYFYSANAEQKRFRAAANPCELDCLQDSGGLDDCRKVCASHPMTYGPASQQR
jgi:hypothetical protein